jgi:hypothetical protein
MLRRLVVAGVAAVSLSPMSVGTLPAAASVLFSCVSGGFNVKLAPGLGHTQTAQTVKGRLDWDGGFTGCSNGQSGNLNLGRVPLNPLASYPTRPLGCPVSWGGAGPDYPDQTPILLGSDPSFEIDWVSAGGSGPNSRGIAKLKASAVGYQWKVLFSITSGQYAPPSGQKTQLKGTFAVVPIDAYTCADDSDRITKLNLNNIGDVIVKQE